jgi:hypothetical protein
MKRIFALLTALILLSLTACSDTEAKTDNQAAETTGTVTEAETLPSWYLPAKDYEGTVYNILTAAEQWIRTYESELTGDIIDDAVYKRNRDVEERFNVKLNYVSFNGYMAGMDAVKTALSEAVLSGTNEFDIMVADGYYVGDYIFDNLLMPLDGLEAFDFDREHWLTDTIEQHKLNGRVYFAAGYWSINTIRMNICLFVNRVLAESKNLEDTYDLVFDGKWTIDRMLGQAKQTAGDIDGNGKMDENDLWGIVTSGADAVCPMQTAMGYKFTESADGRLRLKALGEQLVEVNDKLFELLENKEYTFKTASSGDVIGTMLGTFAGGNALFMIYRLDMTEQGIIRGMDGYGLLPLPKLNEAQEEYIGSGGCDIAAIPMAVRDSEMSAVICDALSSYGYYDVLPKYYDTVLAYKYTRDDNSIKMLDFICKNIYTDPAVTFAKMLDSVYYKTGTSSLASKYDSKIDSLNKKLSDALDQLGQQP